MPVDSCSADWRRGSPSTTGAIPATYREPRTERLMDELETLVRARGD
ncbi:hypothetical protein [Streptosporangium sp. KLBMP 9127]